MFNKIYEFIKKFIKENLLFILFLFVTVATLTYRLPYYIYISGGILDISKRIEVKDGYKINGSYNMCYVSELDATIPTYLLSYIFSDWDVVPAEDLKYNSNETEEDVLVRDKIYLLTANQNALITAFRYSNSNYEILESSPIVLAVDENSNTDLVIGDEIKEIDGVTINSIDDLTNYLLTKSDGDKIELKVINNSKEYNRYAYLFTYEGKLIIGIAIDSLTNVKSDPEVKFKFTNNEYGSSGGLMLSLALYDTLVEDDLAGGLKIAGTGTIDLDGNVGPIGGVKYKLKGAVKNKADIFFVPSGENYEEAIKLKEKHNYNIEVVEVSTFNDALEYLKNR